MLQTTCIACQFGDHAGCLRGQAPPPGMMGGWVCRCRGDCVKVEGLRMGMILNEAQQALLQEVMMGDEEKTPAEATPGKVPGEGNENPEQDVNTSGQSLGGDADSSPEGDGPSGGAPADTSGGTSGDSSATGAGPSGGAE